nr:MAG TPA: hypothetical protein [Caudoviricetes sp.]
MNFHTIIISYKDNLNLDSQEIWWDEKVFVSL